MTGQHVISGSEAAVRLPELLQHNILVPVVVTGTSMTPFLRHKKDKVYLQGIQYVTPKKGDIVFFQRKNTVSCILHRIYKINADGTFLVNGDAQNWFEVVERSQIIGIVTKISRNGREPFAANRWDLYILQKIWRLLLPIRPQLLRFMSYGKRKFKG